MSITNREEQTMNFPRLARRELKFVAKGASPLLSRYSVTVYADETAFGRGRVVFRCSKDTRPDFDIRISGNGTLDGLLYIAAMVLRDYAEAVGSGGEG